jgi:hypothetical protein
VAGEQLQDKIEEKMDGVSCSLMCACDVVRLGTVSNIEYVLKNDGGCDAYSTEFRMIKNFRGKQLA